MIEKITIQGYKSVNEQIAFTAGQITALAGENNAGKTNIMQAMNGQCKGMSKKEKDAAAPIGEAAQDFSVKFYDADGKDITNKYNKENVIYIPADKVSGKEQTKTTGASPFRDQVKDLLGSILKEMQKNETMKKAMDTLCEQVKKETGNIFSDTNEFLQKNARTKIEVDMTEITEDAILKELLKIGAIDGRLQKQSAAERNSVDLENLGQGTQRLLIIGLFKALAQVTKETDTPRLILIEEPEIFLHPKFKRSLLEVLKKLVRHSYKENGTLKSRPTHTQIILTTHDPYFVHYDASSIEKFYAHTVYRNNAGYTQMTLDKVFGIEDEMLHILLYSRVLKEAKTKDKKGVEQDNNKEFKQKELEEYIKKVAGAEIEKRKYYSDFGKEKPPEEPSLPIYIRNQIHHPENKYTLGLIDTANYAEDKLGKKNYYTEDDLKKSIGILNRCLASEK